MNKVSLLVIDDDEIHLFIMNKTIERTGYDVNMIAKENGKLAIDYIHELINNNKPLPDLIFVDINMPVMNGWEFLEEYEHLHLQQKTEMFMLTSSVYDVDHKKAQSFDVLSGFISKPIFIKHLSEIFEDLNAVAI